GPVPAPRHGGQGRDQGLPIGVDRRMRIHRGVHSELEAEANRIIFGHLAKIPRAADKADVLTPWKEHERRRREVYVREGIPDPSLRSGNYHREANLRDAHLNSIQTSSGVKPQ